MSDEKITGGMRSAIALMDGMLDARDARITALEKEGDGLRGEVGHLVIEHLAQCVAFETTLTKAQQQVVALLDENARFRTERDDYASQVNSMALIVREVLGDERPDARLSSLARAVVDKLKEERDDQRDRKECAQQAADDAEATIATLRAALERLVGVIENEQGVVDTVWMAGEVNMTAVEFIQHLLAAPNPGAELLADVALAREAILAQMVATGSVSGVEHCMHCSLDLPNHTPSCEPGRALAALAKWVPA